MEKLDDQTPIVMLSVGQFRQLMSEKPEISKTPQSVTPRTRLNGIRGIAEFLDCSTRTAQELKDKNVFPVYWVGKNLYAYSDEVEAALKGNQNKLAGSIK
jgi:hypothetical protein